MSSTGMSSWNSFGDEDDCEQRAANENLERDDDLVQEGKDSQATKCVPFRLLLFAKDTKGKEAKSAASKRKGHGRATFCS